MWRIKGLLPTEERYRRWLVAGVAGLLGFLAIAYFVLKLAADWFAGNPGPGREGARRRAARRPERDVGAAGGHGRRGRCGLYGSQFRPQSSGAAHRSVHEGD